MRKSLSQDGCFFFLLLRRTWLVCKDESEILSPKEEEGVSICKGMIVDLDVGWSETLISCKSVGIGKIGAELLEKS